ncbi:hypothetical protein EPN29_00915 [bacterium]|nr:MAG: hypothetical protein EPN29_00915 [bacterium]
MVGVVWQAGGHAGADITLTDSVQPCRSHDPIASWQLVDGVLDLLLGVVAPVGSHRRDAGYCTGMTLIATPDWGILATVAARISCLINAC